MNWLLLVLFAGPVICQKSDNSTAPKTSGAVESSPVVVKSTTVPPATTSAPPPTTTNQPTTTNAPPTTTNQATTSDSAVVSGTVSQSSAKASGSGSVFSNSPDPTGDTGSSNASQPVIIFGWVVLASFIAAILAASAWFSYRYYRKKNKIIPDKNLDEDLEYTPAAHLFTPRPSSAVAPVVLNMQKAKAAQSSPLALTPAGSDSSNSARNSFIVPKAYPPPAEHSPYAAAVEEEQNYGHYYEGKDYDTYGRDGNGALYTYGAESVQGGDYESADPDSRFPNKDTLERVISEPSEAGVPDDQSSEPISDTDAPRY
ncbi:hypothetical protein HDV06_000879 [Boothiomyces sp. JEL0866]|nr:hypothetical protein HDV06_000879 [Boothiomyces sp. JEL0866]